MKTNKRFLLGLISAFLLTLGFVHAAEIVDPLSNESPVTHSVAGTELANPSIPCLGGGGGNGND